MWRFHFTCQWQLNYLHICEITNESSSDPMWPWFRSWRSWDRTWTSTKHCVTHQQKGALKTMMENIMKKHVRSHQVPVWWISPTLSLKEKKIMSPFETLQAELCWRGPWFTGLTQSYWVFHQEFLSSSLGTGFVVGRWQWAHPNYTGLKKHNWQNVEVKRIILCYANSKFDSQKKKHFQK